MAKGIITTESGKGAPMRVAPDASAEMIGALAPNTAIELLHYGDGWYFVDVDGVRGYIAGSMVQALDGIEGLGKIKIKKSRNKNGKTDVAVQEVKPATPKANSGLLNKVKGAAKNAAKNAKNKNGKFVMTKEDAKKHLESLIKRAKAAGMTEDEIKQMASLNGLGRLTDLNGLNGKLLDAIKNVGTKIVDTGKKIVGAGQKAEEVKQVLTTPATATAPAPAAAVQPTPATVQADTTNLNTNIQNQSTMTDETKSKIKKIAIASAAVIGATTVGVIIYKSKKKKDAAANNGKGALNGVKKRRKKSKKSKKNTGNKLLTLK